MIKNRIKSVQIKAISTTDATFVLVVTSICCILYYTLIYHTNNAIMDITRLVMFI